ncbi:MAG: hypothetical protein WBX01_09605 [Nitrososphaeraceae archaeon]
MNLKVIGMMLIVAAAASIGLVTIGFQSTMASNDVLMPTMLSDRNVSYY